MKKHPNPRPDLLFGGERRSLVGRTEEIRRSLGGYVNVSETSPRGGSFGGYLLLVTEPPSSNPRTATPTHALQERLVHGLPFHLFSLQLFPHTTHPLLLY